MTAAFHAADDSVTGPWFHLALENLWVWVALHLQNANQPALGPRKGVIHQDVIARHIEFEFDDGCATGWYGYGLHTAGRRALQISEAIDPVEDFADDMEG